MDTVPESGAQGASYSLKEAAERLGVSARSVRRYVRSGQLEAVQAVGLHGPEYRVPEAVLQAYADRVATAPVDRVRLGVVTAATARVDTLSIVAAQLEAERGATREAWLRAEAAWSRIAELEAELATLRATAAPARRSLLDRFRGRAG